MFVAAGLGANWVAIFHLEIHAFLKSFIFLGAGNVMHATNNEINIKNMGGLHKHMKSTSIIMTIASFSLAGIMPLSGYFSKDIILEVAFGSHTYILWAILFITAGLTAFYSFRLVMYVFHGEENFKKFGYHPHETYPFVIAAMVPLAVLAVVGGFLTKGTFVEMITKKLPELEIHLSHSTANILIVITLLIASSGILFAYYKHKKDGTYFSGQMQNSFIYKLLANQFYMPHIIDNVLLKPYLAMSKAAWKIDMNIVDAIVDGIARTVYLTGEKSTSLQSGNLSKSLRTMVIGITILLVISVAYGYAK